MCPFVSLAFKEMKTHTTSARSQPDHSEDGQEGRLREADLLVLLHQGALAPLLGVQVVHVQVPVGGAHQQSGDLLNPSEKKKHILGPHLHTELLLSQQPGLEYSQGGLSKCAQRTCAIA